MTIILILSTVLMSLFLGGCFGDGKPEVVVTHPSDGETGVSVNKKVQVVFNHSIKAHDNWADITLKDGDTLIPTTNSITGAVLWIEPVSELEGGKTYTVTVPAYSIRTKYKSEKCFAPTGVPLQTTYVFSFTTEGSSVSAPTVVSSDPDQNSTGVIVDKTVRVTFSKDIAQGDNWSGIALVQGESAVPVTASIDSSNAKVLVIDPVNDLATETDFVLTVPAGAVKDLETGTMPLAGDFVLNFQTGGPPSVTSTDPTDGQVNVPWNKTITVTFSEDIAQGTNYQMITLKKDDVEIDFTKSTSGNVLTIDPTDDLEHNADYTVTVPAGAVNDTDGFALVTGTTFSFRTSDPPSFVSSDPEADTINVAVDKTVTVTFSKTVVQGSNWDGITLKAGLTDIAITKSVSGSTLTIDPDIDLAQDTTYTVTIPAASVESDTGEALEAETTFSFLTGYPPTITATSPADGTTDIASNSVITVTFDENVLPADQWEQITLQTGQTIVPVTKTYNDNVLTITPQSILAVNTAYTVNIGSEAIKDAAGNVRTDSYSFGFSTSDSFFFEDFSAGIPATWSIVDGYDDGLTWTAVDPGTFNIGSPFTNPCGIIDSNSAGAAYMDEELITPEIDISNGAGGTKKMEFANCFTYYAYGLEEVADVDVMTYDGVTWSPWTNVLNMTGQSFGPELRVIDLNTLAAGNMKLKLRFHYYNARSEFWWLIDDVRVYETP